MLLSTEEQRQECREIAKRRVTADGLVTPDPAFIHFIAITPKDNKKCTVKIYDGHSNVDDFYMDLRSNTQVTRQFHFTTPMFFNKGIYVDVDGDTLSVILHFLPVKE